MNELVSIQKIGDSYGIILPERHLDRVGWKEGDLIEIHSDAAHIEFFEPGYSDTLLHDHRAGEGLTAGTAMRNYYAALKQFAKA
jgi:bifunctional DNA-binding transcriptional regulator/antitoxin component of YhaV-PrlF toxin-antitoxin module